MARHENIDDAALLAINAAFLPQGKSIRLLCASSKGGRDENLPLGHIPPSHGTRGIRAVAGRLGPGAFGLAAADLQKGTDARSEYRDKKLAEYLTGTWFRDEERAGRPPVSIEQVFSKDGSLVIELDFSPDPIVTTSMRPGETSRLSRRDRKGSPEGRSPAVE